MFRPEVDESAARVSGLAAVAALVMLDIRCVARAASAVRAFTWRHNRKPSNPSAARASIAKPMKTNAHPNRLMR